jgi:sarcosine oxidase subunit beta
VTSALPHGPRPRVVPGACTGGLRASYDVVIVGAGVQGLALAYELGKLGISRVAVLDAAYPGAGASGRNGELIRSAFASTEWVALFHESLKRWHTLSAELDFNVLFTPAGYVVLGSTQAEMDAYAGHVALQQRMGLRTELLQAEAVRELAPALAPELVVGAMYQPDAGFAHHDAVVWAYARAAARLGAEIHPYTEVLGIDVARGAVTGVLTSRGPIATRVVVDAAGGMAAGVARLAAVELPLTTYSLEALVTEPLKPFLRPAVSSPALLAYCHQTTRGELVGGAEPDVPRASGSLKATLAGARDMAGKFVRLFPALAGVRVMRHWAGLVSQSADAAPILGLVPEVQGLILDCGWVYGFMGAPAAGALLAEAIAGGAVPAVLAPFALERLRSGELIREGSLVVSIGGEG